jgi:hypothetical protein
VSTSTPAITTPPATEVIPSNTPEEATATIEVDVTASATAPAQATTEPTAADATATVQPTEPSPTPRVVPTVPLKIPPATPPPKPSATATPAPQPTRSVPAIGLKLPPEGSVDANGAIQIDASVIDPNYSSKGMKAMAFQVLARVADPALKDAKINSVEFVVYDSEEDFESESNPVFRHTENNAPFCMFRDSNNKCNRVKAEDGKTWPKSDDDSIEQRPFRNGAYILAITVRGGQDNDLFWHSAIDFKLNLGS